MDTKSRVEAALGVETLAWSPRGGGYTQAGRWSVRLASGGSCFVKAAVDEPTAGWLRDEWQVYSSITAGYLARVLAWIDEEPPVLVLEDLSGAHWPPPWSRERVRRMLRTLEAVGRTPPPPAVPPLERYREDFTCWPRVAAEPGPFLALGFCTTGWLERAIPALIRAEAAARLEGEALLHVDVRSDNICFAAERTVLVDWNWASVGNPRFDIACWLPSLHAEGGPAPDEVLEGEAELAALICGYFAWHAGRPPALVSERVRALQRAQLATALPWAARALGLPPPG